MTRKPSQPRGCEGFLLERGVFVLKQLYLMRHGQTLYNTKNYVQGHCDSSLTDAGKEQADKAAAWLVAHEVKPDRIITSPLGRAVDTAKRVANAMAAAGIAVPNVETYDGIIERSYGELEAGPASKVPCDLWDPGEEIVKFGGEGSCALRKRVTEELSRAMDGDSPCVLAISHGSATLQFLKGVLKPTGVAAPAKLPNCAILHFTYNESTKAFSLVDISDPAA